MGLLQFPKIIVISLLIVTVAVVFFVRNDAVSILYSGKSRSKSLNPSNSLKSASVRSHPTPISPHPLLRFAPSGGSSFQCRIIRPIRFGVWSKSRDGRCWPLGIRGRRRIGSSRVRFSCHWSSKQNWSFGFWSTFRMILTLGRALGIFFAIQHGAKMIFDADDRGEVIDWEVGKRFDLDLFGRSVWPRGLPLENVGEIVHEEYYNEVFGGMQFIQQGISNGLPDVDSVFYLTRKLDSEAFDMSFDEHALKVALPQGVMVPLNSFNTLFHSNAFWGLMLPVSVSSMASDVLRGYWAQRLLWEVGGFVVVYPPTIYRKDEIEAYPFSEEKDLHVNVGRLINWVPAAEADALELDRPRASSGDADRKEFIPRKLPSVHLAVEESGAVNYEIGNLIRLLYGRIFKTVVILSAKSDVDLAVEEAHPDKYTTTWSSWKILFVESGSKGMGLHCNSKKKRGAGVVDGRWFASDVVAVFGAAVGWLRGLLLVAAVEQLVVVLICNDRYLPKIFERFSSAEGFLFLQDNTILNYWNLMQGDKTKLWITDKVPQSWTTISLIGNNSVWFSKQAKMVKKVVNTMPVHLQVGYKESSTSEPSLTICSSEVFYIPQSFVGDFVDLVGLVGNAKIHHKVALPMFFMAMDSPLNFDSLLNTMIYNTEALSSNPSDYYSAKVAAVHPWGISSEPDFIKLIRLMAAGDPLLMELF
ncbi:putative glycosyltransferase STELLO1 [Vitis vinifera]|uniref:Putative glycosyltransferase STELLO1 n=1 Tax=Vitis vinifera TaxID=29760 RepID=A0A438IUG3_VITVI|nr:putative glycosyltransferase STELLO1 [Vitis vinifera]